MNQAKISSDTIFHLGKRKLLGKLKPEKGRIGVANIGFTLVSLKTKLEEPQ